LHASEEISTDKIIGEIALINNEIKNISISRDISTEFTEIIQQKYDFINQQFLEITK
jgi:hypothetical protein